jgi:hypothetical protein
MMILMLPTERSSNNSEPASAGYSGKPLAQKLGLKPGMRALVLNAPKEYGDFFEVFPDGVEWVSGEEPGAVDFIHLFVTSQVKLEQTLQTMKPRILPERLIGEKQSPSGKRYGMIWVSWPKKASGVPTDLDENWIRQQALQLGLVDVKVAAIDEVWSGLKLVIRVQDR